MADDAPRDLAELMDTGLLWLINRQVFHPRGFALALVTEADGTVSGWQLLGDGIEPWNFPDGTENDHLAAANRTLTPKSTKAPHVDHVPAARVELAGPQRIGFEVPRMTPRWWDGGQR